MSELLETSEANSLMSPDVTAVFLTGDVFDKEKYAPLLTKVEFDPKEDVYLSSIEVNLELRHKGVGKEYLLSKIGEYKKEGRRNMVAHIVGQRENGRVYQKELENWYESLGFDIKKYKTKKFGKVSIGVLSLNEVK